MADPATDPFWDDPRTAALIDLALAEDLGAGDRTSEALVPPGTPARGRLAAKERLVVCGLPLLHRVFGALGAVRVTLHAAEGATAVAGRSEEHTSELQSPDHLVCRLLLENK